MNDDLFEKLKRIAEVERDGPLSTMTTLRIGGPARYVVYPDSMVALDALMRLLKKDSIPYKVIGKGSNLLCSDNVFEGVVIRLDKFDDFYFLGNDLIAQAGCSIIALSYQAMKQGLSGLEFASGIPASVGGVTFMNAGAYKRSMSDVIDSVFVYRDEKFEWMRNEECEFTYRHSIFHSHPDWLIIAVRIHLETAPVTEIRDLMESRRKRRMDSQPLDKPSAGSVFQNPEEMPAWQLIDGIGYRGYRIGGAMVSEKHVNFIVNEDHATAQDFLTLVNQIKRLVEEQYHIRLHMEVERFNW